MSSWWLEDTNQSKVIASFEPLLPIDIPFVHWTKDISWSNELKVPSRKVVKLLDQQGIVQGAVSLSDEYDHVFIHLLESAPQNRKIPKSERKYVNVAKLLIAYAGQISIHLGYEGYLALIPKSYLANYYRRQFGAFDLPQRRLAIPGDVSISLLRSYYK